MNSYNTPVIAIPLPNRLPYDPRLETILMVERFLESHSGQFTRYQVWTRLPRKTMYQVFQVILAYLEDSGKITFDRDNRIRFKSAVALTELSYSPRLETILMVEQFIAGHDEQFTRFQIWKRLPRKTMYQVFQIILAYLESDKIAVGSKGKIRWVSSKRSTKLELISR